MNAIYSKLLFFIKFRVLKWSIGFFRKSIYRLQGMRIGKGTSIPKIHVTWPHQVSLGKNCSLEHGIFFKYDGIYKDGTSINIGDNVFIGSGCEFNIKKNITIGNDTLIASGCRFIDHDHGMELGELMRNQKCPEAEIIVGNDVWIGCNSVILKGVKIGNSAIIAAGAIVNRNVEDYEIWGGVPARKIGDRK